MDLTASAFYGVGRVPAGIGALLAGWDFDERHRGGEYDCGEHLSVIDFRAMTERCPHNCVGCFTNKRRKTLTLPDILRVLDEARELDCHGVNYNGEGEPTWDKDFFEIIEGTDRRGMTPIVFTEAASRLRHKDVIERLHDSRASIVIKCDSLFDKDYQLRVLRTRNKQYFEQRQQAIEMLITTGFAQSRHWYATRLGILMLVTRHNFHEVPDLLRYCRRRNIWVVFSTHLPAGRSAKESFLIQNRPTTEQMKWMAERVEKIDKEEFGFHHKIWNNFATHPCVERLQIFGDGIVTPCPGNETVIGNVKEEPLEVLYKRLLKRFPAHNSRGYSGNCLYRPNYLLD